MKTKQNQGNGTFILIVYRKAVIKMADYSELLNIIKKAATEAVDAGNPVQVCFGKVTNASPLQILVDQKMTLDSSFLVLTRNVTDFTTMVTVQWETEKEEATHKHQLKNISTDDGAKIVSAYTETQNAKHTHDIEGTKQMTIHNALEKGEEVVLLRMQGGQKYIVLDRIGGG